MNKAAESICGQDLCEPVSFLWNKCPRVQFLCLTFRFVGHCYPLSKIAVQFYSLISVYQWSSCFTSLSAFGVVASLF